MDDVWFGAGLTHRDVDTIVRALSLRENRPAPLIAIADRGSRLVLASRALFRFFGVEDVRSLGARLLTGRDPGARRLAALCQNLAINGAPRLERLRFSVGSSNEVVTFLCRRILLDGSQPLFIAAALGLSTDQLPSDPRVTVPASGAGAAGEGMPIAGQTDARTVVEDRSRIEAASPADKPQAAMPPAAASGAAPPSPPAPVAGDPQPGEPAPPALPEPAALEAVPGVDEIETALRARWPETRTLRFLWQTDGDLVCTRLSPTLAEVVGPANADLVGRNLVDVAGRLDPAGRLAAVLVGKTTWSGLDVAWPVADAAAAVEIGLGGSPAFRRDRTFDGFRGYGVIRLDRVVAHEPTDLRQAEPAPDPPRDNVVAFPGADSRTLSPTDREAFHALGAELRDRVEAPTAAEVPAPEPAASEIAEPANSEPADSEPANSEPANSEPAKAEPSQAKPIAPEPVLLASIESATRSEIAPSRAVLPELPAASEPPVPPATAASQPEVALAAAASEPLDCPPHEPAGPATGDETASSEAQPAQALRAAEAARNGLVLLDRLQVALLVSRNNVPIFANRHMLDLTGFADEDELHAAGGLVHLFGGLPGNNSGGEVVGVRARDGSVVFAKARMQQIEWDGLPATLLTLKDGGQARASDMPAAQAPEGQPSARQVPGGQAHGSPGTAGQEPGAALAEPGASAPSAPEVRAGGQLRDGGEVRALRAILETASDGVAVLDADCNVLSLNRSGEALFGRDRREVVGKPFLDLFARENKGPAADYLEGLKHGTAPSLTNGMLNDGRELKMEAGQGATVPVFMTLGRLGAGDETAGAARFCALFRDLTRPADRSSGGASPGPLVPAGASRTDLLAGVAQEIRAPLDTITEAADLMTEERFGPLGGARYKSALGDIRAAATQIGALLRDLLDLSKLQAGRLDLASDALDVNRIVSEAVAATQPRASRERVIMRLSLAPNLPPVRADSRSLRQVVLNILANAVAFNEPGGQVIVASAVTEGGGVAIRVRDTGPGMSEGEIAAALEPFGQAAIQAAGQAAATRPAAGGSGLNLPLAKALAEANEATLTIRSKVEQGTMIEVLFPRERVLAG